MCLFCKIKHSFTLCLSTLYLSLVPERWVIFYQRSVKEYIKLLCYTPESSVNFKKQYSVSLWNFLVNTLLLYIPLLTLTDGQTDRQRPNTLAMHGLEEHFSSCAVVSVFGCGRNSFRWYLPTIPVVPLCLFFVAAGNSFWLHRLVFMLWREKVLGVTSLPTIPVVPLCQFFGCGGK
jgi:hypothetical protein